MIHAREGFEEVDRESECMFRSLFSRKKHLLLAKYKFHLSTQCITYFKSIYNITVAEIANLLARLKKCAFPEWSPRLISFIFHLPQSRPQHQHWAELKVTSSFQVFSA